MNVLSVFFSRWQLYSHYKRCMSFLFVFLQVVVVQAISALCQKYPRKHSVMMTFLSNMLRDDVGGLLFNCGELLASILIP